MKQKRLEEAEKMSRSGNNFTHMQVRNFTNLSIYLVETMKVLNAFEFYLKKEYRRRTSVSRDNGSYCLYLSLIITSVCSN